MEGKLGHSFLVSEEKSQQSTFLLVFYQKDTLQRRGAPSRIPQRDGVRCVDIYT